MSDLTAYTAAADLADFFASVVDTVAIPGGCEPPDRVYTAAGEPAVWVCGELVTWVSAVGATDIPNSDVGIDNTSACAVATYVEVNWRLTHCLASLADPKQQNATSVYETEAACFYSLAYGLYRRLQANFANVFTGVTNCNRISQGRFELGQRQGLMLAVAQTIRVQVELLDPSEDSS